MKIMLSLFIEQFLYTLLSAKFFFALFIFETLSNTFCSILHVEKKNPRLRKLRMNRVKYLPNARARFGT
jgi:hypothetical protein